MWRDCRKSGDKEGTPRYIGCCNTPCGSADASFRCPQDQSGWLVFTEQAVLDDFIQEHGISSSPTGTATSAPPPSSTAATTATSPEETSSGPIPPSANQTKSPGLATGSAVGLAIGCVVAGLLLGGLAAILFFRRRRQRHRTPQAEHVQVPYAAGKERDLPPQPVAANGNGDHVQLSQFLLSPSPDNEIVSGLQALNALVRQHVENNYHLQPVQQSPKSLAQALLALGFSDLQGRRSPDDIARLALDARTRPTALQHVIMRVALRSSTMSGGSGTTTSSMLPPSVALFAHSVPATERHRGNAEAVSIAMTKWRQLSAFLLHPHRSERTPLVLPEDKDGVVAQQAQQLARELDRFLGAFVARNSEQEAHLRQVLAECARFGYLLFSQRAEYRFDHEGRQGGGGTVVCPGLERVSDGEGRTLAQPHVLAAPVEDV
ncbi:hypothetical protein PG996_000148 [Apiospora saccharicola]|uniref:Transmembrane protein n=1 Tax=Apiospora saccharicola TaxID=335842 RepID=A0ABR1WEC3_9PEZI